MKVKYSKSDGGSKLFGEKYWRDEEYREKKKKIGLENYYKRKKRRLKIKNKVKKHLSSKIKNNKNG